MTIGDLRKLIKDVPDTTIFELTNVTGAEWYGVEEIPAESLILFNDSADGSSRLLLDFSCWKWEEYTKASYLKEKSVLDRQVLNEIISEQKSKRSSKTRAKVNSYFRDLV